jgi:glycosyltransferase involved in cell wall biosynthesis
MKDRKRTIQDRVISAFNAARFSLTEPVMLKIARARHEKSLYRDPAAKPLISVYVPTYNRARLLVDRAIASVLSQTYKNFELIVLGDHCTDDTEKLVSAIADSRIRLHNLPYRKRRYPDSGEHAANHWLAGPVVPANKALDMVRGEWIARIDDSVIWTPDHLESLLKFVVEGDHEFVTGGAVQERFGKTSYVRGHAALSPYFGYDKPIKEGVYNPLIGGTSTVLYRSYLKFFRYNINCWRKPWNRVNDTDLYIRMFNAGVRMAFLDRNVCDMIPRPGEQSLNWEAFNLKLEDRKEHFKFADA